MAEQNLEGFDPANYRTEVIERWGREAQQRSECWWRGMTDGERASWHTHSRALIEEWIRVAESGADPEGVDGQRLARLQADWLTGIPGTPAEGGRPSKGYLLGLAEMYGADERFARTYGGAEGAAFVCAAMQAYARRLPERPE